MKQSTKSLHLRDDGDGTRTRQTDSRTTEQKVQTQSSEELQCRTKATSQSLDERKCLTHQCEDNWEAS